MSPVDGLHRPGDSPVHRLRPQVKIVALFGFTCAIAATPREAVWAFGCYALLLAGLFALAGVPATWVLSRSLVESPFLVLALAFPFMVAGPELHFGFITVSETGLWAGWNLFAKATLGVWAALLLSATTPVAAHGCRRATRGPR